MDRGSLPAPRWPTVALIPALVVLVVSFAVRAFSVPVADNDLWGHIHFGREILRDGLPGRNLYSYTAPDHPWMNHEILSEIAFASVYDAAGAAGLVGLKTALGLLALGLMLGSARPRTVEPVALAAALIAGASLMSWGYVVRPQIFSFLALAFVWRCLQRHAAGMNAGLWTLPPVFALWINTHGGVLAGLGVLGLFALLHPFTRSRGIDQPRFDSRSLRLATVVVASCCALLLNPYGLDLPIFLVRDVLLDRAITEWASIPLLDFSNLLFKLFVGVFVVAVALRATSPVWEVAILALAIVAVFRHERHLPMFAILLVPFLAESFTILIESLRRRVEIGRLAPVATAAVAAGAVVVAGIQISATASAHRSVGYGIFVSPELFPVQAARFLRENRLRGNLAVPFDWGEYAIWHLYPDFRVSVDGRYTTAYPHDVLEAAWRYLDGSPGWDRVLHGADFALADRRHETVRILDGDRRWHRIHADDTAIVFARVGADLPPSLAPPSPIRVRDVILFP